MCIQGYKAWATAAVQLDRFGQSVHAPTTLKKTETTVRRVLGYAVNVLLEPGQPELRLFLRGDVLASFCAFLLAVRCVRGAQPAPRRALTRALQAQQASWCGL